MVGWLKRILGIAASPPRADAKMAELKARIEGALRRIRPDLIVTDMEPEQVLVAVPDGGMQVLATLVNLMAALPEDPRESDAMIERWAIALVAELFDESRFAIDPDKIMPVLRSPDYAVARVAELFPQRLFAGTVPILLVADMPDAMGFIDRQRLEQAGIDEEEAFDRALANLAARPFEINWIKPGAIGMIVKADDYESSHILNEALWRDLDRSYGGDWLATIEARDLLVFARDPRSDVAQRVVAAVGNHSPQLAHAITRYAFIRRNGTWERAS